MTIKRCCVCGEMFVHIKGTEVLEEVVCDLCQADKFLDPFGNNLEPVVKLDRAGNSHWEVNGKFHRLDGPAVEYANGSKYWYVNDKLHRLGGPAIEWANRIKEW